MTTWDHVSAVNLELMADLTETAHHRSQDLERRGVAGEAVGIGEEIAFE